jgi:hypothetical protein
MVTISRTYFVEAVIGIALIASMYIVPFVECNGQLFSIADLDTVCADGAGQLIQLIGNTSCSLYHGIFLLSWIVGILFLIVSVYGTIKT